MSAASPYQFDPPADGLRRRATAGVLQTGLSQGVRLLVQLGSVVVLSRLLPPSEFGVLAMAGPILAFALLFQDLGLTQAVVQKARLTQAEVSALFCVSLGMSVVLAALLLAAAPLAGWFYGEPRAGALTAALGVNVVLGGVASLPYALLSRRMRFRALALIEAAAAVCGLATSVVLALLLRSFWALYIGNLVTTLVPAIGYWAAAGWRPSWPGRGAGVGAALGFGANVTGFNLANFFSRNLDNVLIGHSWGERPLGLYDRAYKLLLMPLQQVNAPVAKVMLPVLSQMAGEPDRYRRAFLRTLSQLLLVTLPAVAFMVGTADVLIPTLLGKQWGEASPIFTALGMAGFLQVLNNPTGWLFMSQNRTREYMYWGLFGSATCVVGFLLGLPYGPLGVAVAYAASEYVRTPILWWYVTRSGPIRARDVSRMALPHFAGAATSLAAVAAARALLPAATAALPLLAAALLTSFLASALVLATFARGRETIRQALRLAWRPLRRPSTPPGALPTEEPGD